jgi:hypothetical protein
MGRSGNGERRLVFVVRRRTHWTCRSKNPVYRYANAVCRATDPACRIAPVMCRSARVMRRRARIACRPADVARRARRAARRHQRATGRVPFGAPPPAILSAPADSAAPPRARQQLLARVRHGAGDLLPARGGVPDGGDKATEVGRPWPAPYDARPARYIDGPAALVLRGCLFNAAAPLRIPAQHPGAAGFTRRARRRYRRPPLRRHRRPCACERSGWRGICGRLPGPGCGRILSARYSLRARRNRYRCPGR